MTVHGVMMTEIPMILLNGEDVYDENGVDYYYHGEPAYVRYMPKNQ